MNLKKTLACLLALSVLDEPLTVQPTIAMEASATLSEVKALAAEVRSNYHNLVIQQVQRPGHLKYVQAYDYGRLVFLIGKDLKKSLNFDDIGQPGKGLNFFFKKFLTTDQSEFSSYLLAIARLQGECGNSQKNYDANSCNINIIPNYIDGVVLINGYLTVTGQRINVTLCSFFVNALNSLNPNALGDLNQQELDAIKVNLFVFNIKIKEFFATPQERRQDYGFHGVPVKEPKRSLSHLEQDLNLLGLTGSASLAQAKKAFYAKMLQFHPDRHINSTPAEKEAAELKTKEFVNAWERITSNYQQSFIK